jgi:sugar phosphate permease
VLRNALGAVNSAGLPDDDHSDCEREIDAQTQTVSAEAAKSMYYLGAFAGALIITLLVSRLFRRAFKGKVEPMRSVLAAAVTLILMVTLASFGMADGGPPRFGYAFTIYGPAVLLWFIVDCVRDRRPKPQAPPVS